MELPAAAPIIAAQGNFTEEIMIGKVLAAASIAAIVSLPAFAATEYWVAKSASTKKCEVVDKKPDGKKLTDVGSKMYDTKENADKAMKMLNACK